MNTHAASTYHAPPSTIPISTSQCAQGFAALQNALQAGDLEAARGAYAGFWQDVAPQTGPSRMFLPNAQTSHDLQAVGNSLSSANLMSARWAFAMFQKNMLNDSRSVHQSALRVYRNS
jgi:hypothetical protein